MSMHPESGYRSAFAAALLDRNADAYPSGLDASSSRRFRVYRNNVHSSLIDALADAYPVVHRLVGDEFFSAMSREYILTERKRESTLALYGAGFPSFIEAFEPASSLQYLGDVARLERARLESLHAADAVVLDRSTLPSDGEQLLFLRFETHPSLRLVDSPHPVFSIWRANHEEVPGDPISAVSERALVSRPGYSVQSVMLQEPDYYFTGLLVQGETIQRAYELTANNFGDFDISAVFSILLDSGAFTTAITT